MSFYGTLDITFMTLWLSWMRIQASDQEVLGMTSGGGGGGGGGGATLFC